MQELDIIRRETFSAVHRLYKPEWDNTTNDQAFGPCANPHFHGHNFELVITVRGPVDPTTGFVVDLKKLGQILRSEVVEKVHMQNLNEVDFMAGRMCSCENLVMAIREVLSPRIRELAPQARLQRIFLRETEKNAVELTVEGN